MDNTNAGLTIAHLNIRGLVRKVDEIKIHIINNNLKILHLSETFLTPGLDSSILSIKDYNIIRRDRSKKHGGGVLTYLHHTLQYSIISNLDDLPESITIKITQPSAKPFITSVIYRPPNSSADWINKFETYLDKCKDMCEEVIILGDFNINLNVPNKKWNDLVNQHSLLQLIQDPTRIQEHSTTLIDHIYVNKPTNIHKYGTIDIGLSDHSMIYVTRKLGLHPQTRKNRKKITYYDWKNFSSEEFQSELRFTSWKGISESKSADQMIANFNNKLQSIISRHLKLKTRYVKSSILPPWLDQEVEKNIHHRDYLKKNKRWDEYKKQRNYTTNLIRKKKRQHIANLISQSENKQTKQLWNVLRNKQQASIYPNSDKDLPLKNITNSLNHHFVNIVCSPKSDSLKDSMAYYTSKTELSTQILPNISTDDVILLFKTIDIKKATGNDKLSVRILRLALPYTHNIITDIINTAIAEGTFPAQWKIAIVTPLHKDGDHNTLTNYRPISVLPILSKIYEKHILSTLHTHLHKHKLINDSQSGFRKLHSCTTAMQHLYSTWLNEMKNNKLLTLIFLDFRKAFDVVNHQILQRKLEAFGIGGNFLKILRSFLSNRKQCVKIGNCTSDMLPITSGVPQGSILSPTLFQIYINDLLSLTKFCKVHAYADDTTFYISSDNPQLLQQQVNIDMNLIQRWCKLNMMELNISKSHYLLVNNKNNYPIHINIGGHLLKKKTTTKLLGFMINDSMDWKNHISHISEKISSNMRLFYNLRHLLNFTTARHYYYNFIHSYLIYGVHLYYSMSPTIHTDTLYILQKKALRLICINHRQQTYQRTMSTKFAVDTTSILPLPMLSLYFTCLYGFRIKKLLVPTYITDNFQQTPSLHKTRDQHKLYSSINHNKLNLHILNCYNSLPKKLRLLSTVSFKKHLKLYYLSQ